tara:strand:+ start:47 stop:364 length:318 start_codon:yes stop_codon:yes gene_type:complete
MFDVKGRRPVRETTKFELSRCSTARDIEPRYTSLESHTKEGTKRITTITELEKQYIIIRTIPEIQKTHNLGRSGVLKKKKAFLGPRLSELTKSIRAAPDATGAPQ